MKKSVVVDRHVPKKRIHKPVDLRPLPKEPAREVDQVNSLVNQLSAARLFRVRPPFFVVAYAAAMSITGADEHERAHHSGFEDLPSLLKGRMVAVIVAGTDHEIVRRSAR